MGRVWRLEPTGRIRQDWIIRRQMGTDDGKDDEDQGDEKTEKGQSIPGHEIDGRIEPLGDPAV
jgi:hypothetical protein